MSYLHNLCKKCERISSYNIYVCVMCEENVCHCCLATIAPDTKKAVCYECHIQILEQKYDKLRQSYRDLIVKTLERNFGKYFYKRYIKFFMKKNRLSDNV